MGDSGRSAGATSRRERVTSATLPDFDLNVLSIEDLQELYVGLSRKIRVHLEIWPIGFRQLRRNGIEGNDTVRITDGGSRIDKFATLDLYLLIGNLARWTGHGDFRALKIDLAHLDGDELAVLHDNGFYMAARSFHRKLGMCSQLLIPKKTRENAQAVAAFFGFRTIRIKDAKAELALLGRQRSPENTIGAYAEISVANDANLIE